MRNYIVVAYYTEDTVYKDHVINLITSCILLEVPYYIEGIEDRGGWYANINYKPEFLQNMAKKFKNKAIVYVDCDAVFKKYPDLFDELADKKDVNVGIHEFDRGTYGANQAGMMEILSGTIFLQNNEASDKLLEDWKQECRAHPNVWDQKSLEKVIGRNFTPLPGEYCKIFDQQKEVTDPVIVHYQASRAVKRNGMSIK